MSFSNWSNEYGTNNWVSGIINISLKQNACNAPPYNGQLITSEYDEWVVEGDNRRSKIQPSYNTVQAG